MTVCYCGYLLEGGVHVWSRSKWCFPDEPETLDLAEPETDAQEGVKR